jgi:HK97 gp10 family phage protein
MHITCKTKGVQEVITNLKKYDEETQQKIGNVVNTSLKNIARGARQRLPQSKTGNLRKGLKKKYSKKATGGAVTSKAPHSHLVEFGTKPHALTKGASRDSERAVKRKRTYVQVINGNPVDGEHIMHPGTEPRPFLQPAYYAERSNYIENLKKAVKPD